MPKPRRKSEIRAAAQQVAQTNDVRNIAPRDWRLNFLNALIDSLNVSRAASAAGVKRSRVYAEQFNPDFQRAFRLARYYGDNRINWVSRPIWPPSPETIQRHESTFQRICGQ